MKYECKYPNLGYMNHKMRVPDCLHTELEKLFTELDRLAVCQDPCELLSTFCDQLNKIKV